MKKKREKCKGRREKMLRVKGEEITVPNETVACRGGSYDGLD